MTGPATFGRDAHAASEARSRLATAAAAMAAAEDAKRSALAALVQLWPTSAWLAAGATSAKRWLLAYTGCSEHEAHRLERVAGLCHRHPALADAVLGGALSLPRAERLGAAVNPDREPWLADSLAHLLGLDARGCTDEDWSTVVRHWASLVDQERAVRQVPRHSLTMCQRLFGGGEIHADLSPSAFANVATAIDGWTDDPDPQDGPYQRSLSERRADALDDLCHASLDQMTSAGTRTAARNARASPAPGASVRRTRSTAGPPPTSSTRPSPMRTWTQPIRWPGSR